MIRQKDIAAELGVSRSTVAMALSSRSGVAETTRRRVEEAAARLGYGAHSNRAARTMIARRYGKRVRSGVIGVGGYDFALPGQESPYWGPLLSGIRSAAALGGLRVLLLDDISRGFEMIDGLLLCDWSPEEALNHVPPDLPCVSLLVPVAGMTSVYVDDYAGARKATEHLLSLGHHRIGYLHSRDKVAIPHRLNGYRDALQAAGLDAPASCERILTDVKGDYLEFVEAGRAVMKEWIGEDWNHSGCSALLAQNDYVAIGAIQELQVAGWRVPQDVSVMGFDGLEIGRFFSPRLSTIKIPLCGIGEQAMQTLHEKIESGADSCEHFVLPAQLQEGQSCAAPAADRMTGGKIAINPGVLAARDVMAA